MRAVVAWSQRSKTTYRKRLGQNSCTRSPFAKARQVVLPLHVRARACVGVRVRTLVADDRYRNVVVQAGHILLLLRRFNLHSCSLSSQTMPWKSRFPLDGVQTLAKCVDACRYTAKSRRTPTKFSSRGRICKQ